MVKRHSRAVAYHVPGPLAFQRATLKSWEWPGDEANFLGCVRLSPACSGAENDYIIFFFYLGM